MRKKELFEQNTVLHNRLHTVSVELKKYKELYSKNIAEINSLRQQLAEMEIELLNRKNEEKAEPCIQTEEKAVEEKSVVPELEEISQYGAEIIGKIVMEGTKISNSFVGNSNDLSVDLINLLLGKTEVCKAKIYDICRDDISDSEKKNKIDAVYGDCIDYFSSLIKQI